METIWELSDTDSGLIQGLTRLADWQDFEVFQTSRCRSAMNSGTRCLGTFLNFVECELPSEPQQKSSAAHEAIRQWLPRFFQSQIDFEAADNQLNWIKSQWPKVVAEVVDSISKTPELQMGLEAKFRKQTHATFNAILNKGGRPSQRPNPPDAHLDDVHRLLHWSS